MHQEYTVCRDPDVAQAYRPEIVMIRILMIARACRLWRDTSTIKDDTGAHGPLLQHEWDLDRALSCWPRDFNGAGIITHHQVITFCIITQQEDG